MPGRISYADSDKIWKKWAKDKYPNVIWHPDLNRVSRRSPSFVEFDNMLFAYGGLVRQENHKKYFEFFNEEDATAFILTYA